jgi:hypothetical protein
MVINSKHMKKKLLYIALIVFGFIASCTKDEDPIFTDPDTRLSAELAADQALLIAPADGWKATIYPKGGKGFTFYFKFAADSKVAMMADINASTASAVQTSTYRLKALQRPTLIFDTYNYIHMIADPDASISGGSNAAGLQSDFEFAFDKAVGDTVKFEGTFYGNKMEMVKLKTPEAQSILGGGWKTILTDAAAAVTSKILYIVLDGKQVPLSLSVTSKSFSIAGQSSSPFAFNLEGLTLKNVVTFGTYKFDKVYWDATGKFFYLMNGTTKIKIEISPAPLPLDVTPLLHTEIFTRWTSMQINVANLGDLSADFLAKYNTANASLGTLGNAGRYIEYITILFNANNTVTFQIRYRNPSSPTSFFLADFIYNMTLDNATGIAKFTSAATPAGNAATIRTYVTALIDYFAANRFKIAYISAAATPAGSKVGGFLSQDNTASFFYGVLIQ